MKEHGREKWERAVVAGDIVAGRGREIKTKSKESQASLLLFLVG